MFSLRVDTISHARIPHLVSGVSSRPALTQLAMLMCANEDTAARVLCDPTSAGNAHPQYTLDLDAQDCATLCDIRTRSHTVEEFLMELADVVDGPSPYKRWNT